MQIPRLRRTPEQKQEQREQAQHKARVRVARLQHQADQRQAARAERKQRRAASDPVPVPESLRIPRQAALIAIAVIIAASSLTAFAESYRGLFDWSHEHGLSGTWAATWPLMVDSFIAVGELALFVAMTDRWTMRQRLGAWAVTLFGLTVSVAGNIGHVHSHHLADRGTAAVPPLAAAAALAVGLGVLKRVVGRHAQVPAEPPADPVLSTVPSGVLEAAKASMKATVAAGNPWSVNALKEQFALSRAQATEVRASVLGETNGHALPGGAS